MRFMTAPARLAHEHVMKFSGGIDLLEKPMQKEIRRTSGTNACGVDAAESVSE